jgi:hypothetical protein
VPEQVLLNVASYVGGHDFTGDSNQGALSAEAAALDATTFRSQGWSEQVFGLKSAAFNLSGFWASAVADAVDPDSFGEIGIVDRVHTIAMNETEGAPAYMFLAGKSSYNLLQGSTGETAKFAVASQGTNGQQGVVRGQLAKAKGAASAIGQMGSVVQLGAVAAGQYLYASLHAFTAGTTLTVQLQSATTLGFAGPTTRYTFPAVTTRGGLWAVRVAGPITDQYYRLNISAVTGAFVAAGAIGIGS